MERLPYAQRMRNRCIAITVLVTIIIAIVHCSTKDDTTSSPAENAHDIIPVSIEETDTNAFYDTVATESIDTANAEKANGLAALTGIEDKDFSNASDENKSSETSENVRDTAHIKSQKDPYLADKIDILLRRYHPDLGVILVVDTKTNEILAWGERRDGKVQNKPDWIGRASFPAASLAKLVTIAAAMESNRYSLNTPIRRLRLCRALRAMAGRIMAMYSIRSRGRIRTMPSTPTSSRIPRAITGWRSVRSGSAFS